MFKEPLQKKKSDLCDKKIIEIILNPFSKYEVSLVTFNEFLHQPCPHCNQQNKLVSCRNHTEVFFFFSHQDFYRLLNKGFLDAQTVSPK